VQHKDDDASPAGFTSERAQRGNGNLIPCPSSPPWPTTSAWNCMPRHCLARPRRLRGDHRGRAGEQAEPAKAVETKISQPIAPEKAGQPRGKRPGSNPARGANWLFFSVPPCSQQFSTPSQPIVSRSLSAYVRAATVRPCSHTSAIFWGYQTGYRRPALPICSFDTPKWQVGDEA
jgi:hypothetical protein